jgi:methylated-DNA-[protein]-cysteine S-methyltransferase
MSSTCTHSTQETPIGPFSTVLDADGAVLAAGWTADVDDLLTVIHPSLRPAEPRRADTTRASWTRSTRYRSASTPGGS